jgi:hypothetical protein
LAERDGKPAAFYQNIKILFPGKSMIDILLDLSILMQDFDEANRLVNYIQRSPGEMEETNR